MPLKSPRDSLARPLIPNARKQVRCGLDGLAGLRRRLAMPLKSPRDSLARPLIPNARKQSVAV